MSASRGATQRDARLHVANQIVARIRARLLVLPVAHRDKRPCIPLGGEGVER